MSYIRPVASGPITDDFGEHVARGSKNPGVDYAVPVGTNVVAPEAGTIAKIDTDTGGAAGRWIVIYHPDGKSSDLLHLSKVLVTVGQNVTKGQHIAESGGSANGKENGVGAHLHWTLRTRQTTTLANVGNVDGEKFVTAAGYFDTRAVQTRLNVWLKHWGLPTIAVDGAYGPKSRAAITEAQKRFGLVQDGKMGPKTWEKISQSPVIPPPVVTPPKPEPPVVTPPAPQPPVVAPVELSPTEVNRVSELVIKKLIEKLAD